MADKSSHRGSLWTVLKRTFSEFIEDKCPRLGAALAYYTVFSMAPLLVILVAAAGRLFPTGADRARVQHQLTEYLGSPDAGTLISTMIDASSKELHSGFIASIVSIVVLLIGASTVFAQLQDALNTIWEVAPKPGRGVLGMIRDRLLSFSLVFGVFFILMASLLLSAAVAALSHYMGARMGGGKTIWLVGNFILSLAVVALLFGMMYKLLPDVKMAWRDVWIGAVVTAILFEVGKYLLGFYLAHASVASAFGAAGSLAALLVWIYYSSQIYLIGAEFTHAYAMEMGPKPVVDENAVPLTDEMRNQQGIPHAAAVEAAAKQDTAATTGKGGKGRPPRRTPERRRDSLPHPAPATDHRAVAPLVTVAAFGLGVYVGRRRRQRRASAKPRTTRTWGDRAGSLAGRFFSTYGSR